jgi:mycothiol synthase
VGELRPPRDDEFDALLELMNAHQLAVFGEADTTADELRTWLTTPYVVIERDLRVLEQDGRLVAYADVDPTRDDPPVWWCDVKLAPDADVESIAEQLVAWLEQRAQKGTLRVWTSAADKASVDRYERLGFTQGRHSYRMDIDLADEPRQPVWPDGVTVRTMREDEHERVYEAVREVWRDTSDPMDETFDEWAHWTIRTEAFDPSLWFLAFAGEELAGFSLCREDPTDSNAGYVATLGVRRPGRRQGLGEALLLHSFGEFRRRSYRRATLGVDASSPTGATRLYERAGMRAYRDTVFLEKRLP